LLRLHIVQDASCGNGNIELKCVRNAWLSGCDVVDCDTKSAIHFVSPGIWKVASNDASPASIHSAKALSRCAAIEAFVASRRDDHATVGVLSHPIATWVWATSAMTSSTSHWHSIPAISKSEFVSWPVGLDSDTIACWMSSGKVILHTIGGSGLLIPNHTLLAPIFDASQYLL